MPELGETLSQRELEVMQCIADGASNKEIATSLTISQNTVKVHLRNIFNKLGVSSRTEAMTAALQQGILALPSEASDDELSMAGAADSIEAETLSLDQVDLPEQPTPGSQTRRTEDSLTREGLSPMPSGRRIFNRFTVGLLLILLVAAGIFLLIRLDILQFNATPTPEPFAEIPVGNTGWIENRSMKMELANMAVAAVGLNVYQIGGETSDGVTNAVFAYNTTNHLWQEAASKPTAVADASASVLFGEIYVPGGRLADGTLTDTVEAYSPANDAWRSIAALPKPVAGGLALSDGSFLYLIGGWDGSQYLDTTYVYDVGADSWRPLPPMGHARAFAAGSTVTGQLYVVGGFDGTSDLPLCQFFDPSTAGWNDCPDMLLPRAGAGAAAVLNKLYVIGGGLTAGSEVEFSEVYDPNSDTWQVVNTPMLSESSTWTHLGVTNVEVRIYALGGLRNQALSAENLVYAPRVFQTFIPAASSGGDN